MVVIDRVLGARAEFLNAWSVVERLLGRSPTFGASVIASRFGPMGELVAVISVNLAAGFLLALLLRLLVRVF